MKISIFGLGYVGCVTAACLAKQGHSVTGVDVVADKVAAVRAGRWPIFEPGLAELDLGGRVTATSNAEEAVAATELSLVCVGTPSLPDGSVDTAYLVRTMENLASAVAKKAGGHLILIRSTVPPGTVETVLFPALGGGADLASRVAFYPEFLREGVAIDDFFNPSLNVLGASPAFPADRVRALLPDVKVPLEIVAIRTAESIKYANNSFHALKIVFANEFARFCRAYGVDAAAVMELFCKDTRLNLSPYYLRPGFAYGGSCLPKELRAVSSLAKSGGVDPILFDAIVRSNDEMITACLKKLYSFKPASIGYFGVTFKPDTDDLRESSVMRVIDAVIGRNRSYSNRVDQIVFDMASVRERMAARSADHIYAAASAADLIGRSDVLVLGPYRLDASTQSALAASGKPVLDLKWFRVGEELRSAAKYHALV